jgi:phage tail sheath protein FI
MAFLHGVETIRVEDGVRVIQTKATSTIGIVGCNGVGGVSAAPTKLGVPQLITPSRSLVDQGIDEDWPVYQTMKIIYDIASPLIIFVPYGTDTGGDNDHTMAQSADKLINARPIHNITPKILITDDPANAPAANLLTAATRCRGIVPVDINAATVAAMITARAGYSSARQFLVGPHGLVGGKDIPLSWIAAAMIAWSDEQSNRGYHYSPSNIVISTLDGTSIPIVGSNTELNSDTNLLNSQGITTVFSGFGTGFRLWGNRCANFPVSAGIETFLSVIRTADVIEDAIETVSLTWMDRPINKALIDCILESINAFFRDKQGDGVIIDGSASIDAARNSATEISNGHLVVSYEFVPPPPLERLTFRSFVNINLLAKLLEA